MESPKTIFAGKPINPDTYLADLRREHPRRQPFPPTFWHIARCYAVNIVGPWLLILTGGIVPASLLSYRDGCFGDAQIVFWTPHFVLGCVVLFLMYFFIGALIVFWILSSFNLIVRFGGVRAHLRERFENELRQWRWIHDSVLLQGVVTKAELEFYLTSFRGRYTDLPPDDRVAARVKLTFAFQMPNGATKTGHWSQYLGSSYYGENNKPDSKNYDHLKKLFEERYGSITGATVWVHYLDEKNYSVL